MEGAGGGGFEDEGYVGVGCVDMSAIWLVIGCAGGANVDRMFTVRIQERHLLLWASYLS